MSIMLPLADGELRAFLRDLGRLVRLRRATFRQSQGAAAEDMGISRATLQRMEQGGRGADGVAIDAWIKAIHYCGLYDYVSARLFGPEHASERAKAVREVDTIDLTDLFKGEDPN